MAILPLLQDVVPQGDEQWKFYTLIFSALSGAVGSVFTWWVTRGTKRDDALSTSQEARVAAAERREAEAKQERREDREAYTKRLDTAIESINRVIAANTELTTTVKQFVELLNRLSDGHRISHDELRKINGSIELFLRETQRRGPYGS
ncbi:MAG: hypothetical protein AB7R89_34665 [Dehalococcoidia bacterium]